MTRYDPHHGRLHVHRFWRPKEKQVEHLEERPSQDCEPRFQETEQDTKESRRPYKALLRTGDDPEYWESVQRKEEEVSQWLGEHRATLPDQVTIMRLDYDLLIAVLTRERIRLVNHLREHGPYESLQQLADEIGRDKTAVSRELSYLEVDLVGVEKVGRRTDPGPRTPILLL